MKIHYRTVFVKNLCLTYRKKMFLCFLNIKKYFIFAVRFNARVAELVDALDSKSCSFGSAGSIPASGTKKITAAK